MTPELALALLLAGFILLIAVGIPLAFALLFSSVFVIALDPGLDVVIVPLRIFSGINSFVLLAIPGFMFSAFLMNRIGVTEDIVALSDLLVGRIRGGLAHINVVASMLLGGVSGSSTADVAGLGAILIPAMSQKGYDKGFSAAITAASSAIGSIIPPSILMVIYGASANISVGALFIAGYIPGILVGLQQIAIGYWYALRHGIGAERQERTPEDALRVLLRGIVPMSTMVVIIGGIIGGIMTATEAAAVAAAYVVLIGAFFYRTLTLRVLLEVAADTGRLTAVVMLCVGTATIFGWLMAYYHILEVAGGLFQQFATGPVTYLLFVTAVFLFLGTFMDPAPAMLVFVPVVAPIADQLEVHPLLLGIVVVMTLAIGKITPPYGISLLLACTIAQVPLSASMRWTMVFLVAFCLLVAALILWPEITLVLPRLLVPELAGG
jgi:tripartite ATP-independent transporter DctM subunit